MTHPNHETALMLLRAAGYKVSDEENILCRPNIGWQLTNRCFLAMAAALDAQEKAMREALEKMAEQKLQSELTDDEWNNSDFHDAYDQFIMTARDALAALTGAKP